MPTWRTTSMRGVCDARHQGRPHRARRRAAAIARSATIKRPLRRCSLTCSSRITANRRARSFLISMPRTTPFTASRKAAFSTAITAVSLDDARQLVPPPPRRGQGGVDLRRSQPPLHRGGGVREDGKGPLPIRRPAHLLAASFPRRTQGLCDWYDVYKPGLDLTVSVWMGGRVYLSAVVMQRSFFSSGFASRKVCKTAATHAHAGSDHVQ